MFLSMKEIFKTIREDKIAERSFFIGFAIIILGIFYIAFYYQNLPPYLPLFNQLPWGEQRLSKTIGIFIPPLIAFLILILNFFFSSVIYKKTPLLSRILAITSFLIAVLTFLFVIRTVQIVL